MTHVFDAVVIADAWAMDNAVAAVGLAGGVVAAQVGWDAVDTLDGVLVPGQVVLVEAADRVVDEAMLAAVAAVTQDAQLVVTLDEAAIDLVAALLMGPTAQLLCRPGPAERVAALALAGYDATPGAVRETDGDRLRRVNREVARIAAMLTRLVADTPSADEMVEDRRRRFDAGPAGSVRIAPQAVRDAIRARRMRDSFFPPALFEDPAWDILLDLFAAELESVRVSVSSLCIASAVASTTALRWISRMTAMGLLVRQPDPQDRRRVFLALATPARNGMRNYLSALAQAGLPIP